MNNLMRFFLDKDIAEFYEYLNTLDQVLSTRHQDLSTNIEFTEQELKDLNPKDNQRKELIDLKVESERVKGFTNLLRQSFLTSLYSFMELMLVRECYLDSKSRDNGKSYRDTKGKGIDKVKNYFSRIIGSDYPFGSSQDWLWVKKYQNLRDCIVHRQGSLTGFSDFEIDSTLAKFVEQEKGLSLFGVNNNQIFIEYEFCLRALQTIHRFLSELMSVYIKAV